MLKDHIIQLTPLVHLFEPTDKNLLHTKKPSQVCIFMYKVKVLGKKSLNDFHFTRLSMVTIGKKNKKMQINKRKDNKKNIFFSTQDEP